MHNQQYPYQNQYQQQENMQMYANLMNNKARPE